MTEIETGEIVTAEWLNTVGASISNDGSTWTGAVAGTTGSFTPSLEVAGAPDNGGLFITATGANRPIVSLQNETHDVLAVIQGTDNLGVNIFANGGATLCARGNPNGSLSVGGASDPGTNGLGVAGTIAGATTITAGTNITSSSYLRAADGAFGTGVVSGNAVFIGGNTSGNGAPGYLNLRDKQGGDHQIWSTIGAPGTLRISQGGAPVEVASPSDTSGTVVGDQTSWHEAKTNIRPTAVMPEDALAAVLAAPIYDYEYRDGSYETPDGQPAQFTGYVGYDRDSWFLKNVGPQQIPALNEISILGRYALAFKAMAAQVEALQARVAELEAR